MTVAPTTKSKYARLRMNGKTFFAKILSENSTFIHFRKVDKYGDEKEEKMVKGQHVITEHLVMKGLITRRTEMVMSHVYAELEPVKP